MSPRRPAAEELSSNQILDAARQVFGKQGYHAVSMREIAREVGCSHGAIYYHFKDKSNLFAALIKKDFHLLNDLLQQVTNQPHNLEDILLAFIEFGLTNRYHFEVMFVLRDVLKDPDAEQVAVNSYEKFAQCMSYAHGSYLSPEKTWSIFLAVYGFIVHYLHHDMNYEHLHPLAVSHVSLLVKSLK